MTPTLNPTILSLPVIIIVSIIIIVINMSAMITSMIIIIVIMIIFLTFRSSLVDRRRNHWRTDRALRISCCKIGSCSSHLIVIIIHLVIVW